MSILTDLNRALSRMRLPVETGIFSNTAPDAYLVIIPLADAFALHADDVPGMDVQEARISLFSKNNYLGYKGKLVQILLPVHLIRCFLYFALGFLKLSRSQFLSDRLCLGF